MAAVRGSELVSLFDDELAMGMAVDVMFDRGFAVRVEEAASEVRRAVQCGR